MASINLCCSIEMEPKTLSEVQLNYAREAAQKLDPKEASILFIKGLESVGVGEEKEEETQESLNPVSNDPKSPMIEKPCQCSLSNNVVDSPDQMNLKEPLSAPF